MDETILSKPELSKQNTFSVAGKDAVARLDEYVGPEY
jgi:hypothetical protein